MGKRKSSYVHGRSSLGSSAFDCVGDHFERHQSLGTICCAYSSCWLSILWVSSKQWSFWCLWFPQHWLTSCRFCIGHPILVGWNSINSNTVRTRTVSAAVYNIMVQIGGIISSNIYRADDAPFYKRGNKVLIGICVFDIFLFLGVKLYYIQRNKYKAKIWESYSAEEKENYLATTKDKGNKRLDFQFHHWWPTLRREKNREQ